MNYYILSNSTDEKVVGDIPQVKMAPDYDFDKHNSVRSISRDNFPEFNPDLNFFVMTPKAKLTDVITVSGLISAKGFLINEKVKNILDKHNLVSHKYYQAKLYYKNQAFTYYWWHVVSDLTPCIDYNQTSFIIKRLFKIEVDNLTIPNAEGLKKTRYEIGALKNLIPNTLVLHETFDKNLDLFIIGGFNDEIFVSEKLKIELEQQKISGIEISKPQFPIRVA
jgi:hypothetical protein